MITVIGNRHNGSSSNPNEATSFSYIKKLGKGMTPNILPPAIVGKVVGQTGLSNLGLANNREGKLWIQTS